MNPAVAADLAPAPAVPGTTVAKAAAGNLRWRAFAALICLPALWMGWFVCRYAVNIPSYDAWVGMAPLFQSLERGTLSFADFAQPHNEHRILVPRVIFYLAARLSHWDVRVETRLTWVVFLIVAANLWKLLEVTGWRARPSTYTVFGLIALWVFSPLQIQNLSFGFQFHFVLPLAFITGAILAAAKLRRPASLVVAALLASAATFSMATGLAAWVLALPLLVQWRNAKPWKDPALAAWGLLFGLHVAICAIGFHPPGEPDSGLGGLAHHPWIGLHYFLVFLSAPFAFALPIGKGLAAGLLGAGLLAWVGLLAWKLWQRRHEPDFLACRALPWMMVAATGVISAVLTTAGRFQLGFTQAFESRYVPYALMLPIGLLVLTGLLLPDRRQTLRTGGAIAAVLGVASLAVLHLVSVWDKISLFPVVKHQLLYGRTIVQCMDVVPTDSLFKSLSAKPELLRESAHAVNRLGYFNPPLLQSPDIRSIAGALSAENHAYGLIDLSQRNGDQLVFGGWAILPERMEPADAVLLTCDDPQGTPNIVGVVNVAGERPDIQKATGERALLPSGWVKILNVSQLAAPGPLRAWAYDAEQGRAWPLKGAVQLR